MTSDLSPNTQAILLLTAPLIVGHGPASSDLLSPGEYKRLARHLREIQKQPADLISSDTSEILRACHQVVDESRLQRLLARGFLLSQAVERWQTRAIWVVSRADAAYPQRFKIRLREDAPVVIYGCGDVGLLKSGGLAVVGSRHVSDALIDYTRAVGQLAAEAGRTLVSGGAKGIDQAAMQGALGDGGQACGVLADSLEKSVMNREHRNLLIDGNLTLISPYDPGAGFNVGNAMRRNKLIYALADVSLVVNSDFQKGGTWTGAIEQLDKLKLVPVFVRSTGEASAALDSLRERGALPWPNPRDVASFDAVFDVSAPIVPQAALPLIDKPSSAGAASPASALLNTSHVPQVENEPLPPSEGTGEALPFGVDCATAHELPPVKPEGAIPASGLKMSLSSHASPAEALFSAVCVAVQQVLSKPMKEADVAAALKVSTAQAKTWLQRLVDEGVVEKQKRPAGYVVKQQQTLGYSGSGK